jgi:hypothetical protein
VLLGTGVPYHTHTPFASRATLTQRLKTLLEESELATVGAERGQPMPTAIALTTLTSTSVTIATLAFLVAFLVNAYNTGKIFGLVTVPQTWLPYVGVGIPFVSAVYASLSAAGALTAVAWFNGVQAGLFALLASAGGSATHAALVKHVDAPKLARLAKGLVVLCFIGLVGRGVIGCKPAAAPVAACVSTVIEDAVSGMSIAQIIAAAGPGCVTDAEDVIAILIGSTDARLTATPALAEAKTVRGMK